MKLADIIRTMAALGASAEAIAVAVEAIEDAQSAVADRRAGDRERKRRQRARAQNAEPADECHGTVTGQSRDGDVTVTDGHPLSRPPNEINSNPPTHTPVRDNSRAREAARMPDDWNPKPLTGEIGKVVTGWPPGALERELERFRDWAASASGKNARKKDWQAAWRNWLRSAEDEGRHRHGRQTHADPQRSIRGPRPDPALDMFLQAQRELREEAEREDQGSDWPPRLALPPQ